VDPSGQSWLDLIRAAVSVAIAVVQVFTYVAYNTVRQYAPAAARAIQRAATRVTTAVQQVAAPVKVIFQPAAAPSRQSVISNMQNWSTPKVAPLMHGNDDHSPWPTPNDGYDKNLWDSRCHEWSGVSLENLAPPVAWLAEGWDWGFSSDNWKNRRRKDLEGIANPLETISNSFKDEWRTSNNCMWDASHDDI